MSAKILSLDGLKQGRLTILRKTGVKSTSEGYIYLCGCYCGNLVEYSTGQLRHKQYARKSCGHCKPEDKYKAEYTVWGSMMQRCTNKNNARYASYGGRGITVCTEWFDFYSFLLDVGLRPSSNHSLDRIDVNKGYYKDNCRWATATEQNCNKRKAYYGNDITREISSIISESETAKSYEQLTTKLRDYLTTIS